MELQTAAVDHHLLELRQLADQLRLERDRSPSGQGAGRLTAVRVAFGRAFVAIGGSLLEGTGTRASVSDALVPRGR